MLISTRDYLSILCALPRTWRRRCFGVANAITDEVLSLYSERHQLI